jgi:hypothetical protein
MQSMLLRFLALPVLICAVFMCYGYGLSFISLAFDAATIRQYYEEIGLPISGVRSMLLLTLFLPHLLLVFLLAFVFSRIAVVIYQQQALTVAILAVLPVLYIRTPELSVPFSYLNPYRSIASFTSSVLEIGSFTLLICLGTWLHQRQKVAASPESVRDQAS